MRKEETNQELGKVSECYFISNVIKVHVVIF